MNHWNPQRLLQRKVSKANQSFKKSMLLRRAPKSRAAGTFNSSKIISTRGSNAIWHKISKTPSSSMHSENNKIIQIKIKFWKFHLRIRSLSEIIRHRLVWIRFNQNLRNAKEEISCQTNWSRKSKATRVLIKFNSLRNRIRVKIHLISVPRELWKTRIYPRLLIFLVFRQSVRQIMGTSALTQFHNQIFAQETSDSNDIQFHRVNQQGLEQAQNRITTKTCLTPADKTWGDSEQPWDIDRAWEMQWWVKSKYWQRQIG